MTALAIVPQHWIIYAGFCLITDTIVKYLCIFWIIEIYNINNVVVIM